MGPLLNISEDHLNNIEHNHYHKVENCCQAMLSDWLQGTAGDGPDGSATWERLLEAIEDARCGELAKQVKTALPLLGMSIIMIASYWSYHHSLTCRD